MLRMSLDLFEEVQRFSGWSVEDARLLRELFPRVESRFPRIVDDFYRRVLEHEGTRRVLAGPEQVERLKGTLLAWLREVFLGPHDATYFEKRLRIGVTHARVGLSPAYVYTAMSHIRRHLDAAVLEALRPDTELAGRALAALGKILHIDLALIAGSYREAEKYRDLVENAPEMIQELDRVGRIQRVNRTWLVRMGYRPEAVIGRPFVDFVLLEDARDFREHLARVFAKGASRCDCRVHTAQGDLIALEILATVRCDEISGEPVGTRAYLRDVTERRAAERALREERDRAQKYLDVAGVMFVGLDRSGRVDLVNRRACEILGYEEREIVGRDWFETCLPSERRRDVRAVFERILAGDVLPVEFYENPVLTRQGERREIGWHNTVRTDAEGRVLGTLSSGIDLTDYYRLQNKVLEQAGLARLGELAAVVAHEVKNPLAGIRGAVQVLGQRLPPGSAGHPVVEEVIHRVDSLTAMVNDILLFARPRAPKLARVPLLALLEGTAALLREDPELAGIEVEVSAPEIVVSADVELLKPVFLNLLLNAAQAMEGRGRIAVTGANDGSTAKIEVADRGPGIPLELREKVFEPFFSTKRRGTGLGLAIARRIVEAHHGAIEITCPPEGGTTVVVQLPIAAPRGGEG
jgi:PAS domain S-box-containing protein